MDTICIFSTLKRERKRYERKAFIFEAFSFHLFVIFFSLFWWALATAAAVKSTVFLFKPSIYSTHPEFSAFEDEIQVKSWKKTRCMAKPLESWDHENRFQYKLEKVISLGKVCRWVRGWNFWRGEKKSYFTSFSHE